MSTSSNTNEFPTIKVSKEALQSLIEELQELVSTIDTTPEAGHEKWSDDDNFGDFIDASNETRFKKTQIARLLNIGLLF